MRISRLHIDQPLEDHFRNDAPLTVAEDRAHYLRNVLRLKADDHVDLFDGRGGEYRGKVLEVNKKQVRIKLIEFNNNNRTPEREIHLGLSIIKRDAMDTAIQKATELGVRQITPIISEHVSVPVKQYQSRLSHWLAVAISACEQCGMNVVPTVHSPTPLQGWVTTRSGVSYCGMPGGDKATMHSNSADAEINLLVGPEGGFSQEEASLIQNSHFRALDLGKRILRAETAAISLMTLFSD
jgi:16S rRNA (uracil1498-N3)-methyltransferase